MAIDPDLFRAVLGRFATGVTIVTTRDGELRDHGMTVSAFSSVSLDPPLVMVCIGTDATMAPVMHTAETFTVNVLSADQEAMSRRFSGKLDNRFSGLGFSRGLLGNAILDDVLASLECRVVARHAAGDHVLVIGEVHAGAAHDQRPLLYYRGGYSQLER